MTEFKYSVVVCSFNKINSVKMVADKIKSLRPDCELILSDDFSTDGTIEWAKESGLFDKIHIQDSSGNYRLNTVRNCGINLASNKYVIILDGDCVPEDSFFYAYDTVFSQYPDSVAIGITEKYDSEGKELRSFDPRWIFHTCEKIVETNWENFYGGNVAFPKHLWENDKFDESYNGFWGFEDLDFSVRLYKKNVKFYLSFLSSVRHLEHPVSKNAEEAAFKENRNRSYFEKKHGIVFSRKNDTSDRNNIIDLVEEKKISNKKIIISKNVKALRNGERNPKDYPYWDELISLLDGNDITIIDKEIPLKELSEMIRGCDFFISTDSFFQHYAWDLGKSGAVIFSVTDPSIFGHELHINILKDRKYLRKNQFLFMEQEPYNIEAFEKPEKVYKIVSLKFQKLA